MTNIVPTDLESKSDWMPPHMGYRIVQYYGFFQVFSREIDSWGKKELCRMTLTQTDLLAGMLGMEALWWLTKFNL